MTAAAEVLRESGYRAASLDEILRRSEVAKSNFYYHFDSKQALACATLDYLCEAIVGPLFAALGDRSLNGLERLRAFANGFAELYGRGTVIGCPFGMLAVEDDLEPVLRKRCRRVLDQASDGVCAAIRDGQGDGSITVDSDPEALAESFVALLEGAGLLARATREGERIQLAATPFLELLARPSANPPRRRG
jgi:TetR/AcrR family transcriptional regulator, transcriptional repressor for nem operon